MMTRSDAFRATVAAAFVVLFSGCNTMRDLNIQNPRYSIRDVRPRVSVAIPLSASTIDFDLMIEVENPNFVALNLDRIDFDLFVDESRLVEGQTREQIRIPANGRGDVRLNARVGYQNIRALFREIAQSVQGDRARYELRGRAYYNTPIGRLDFPFAVTR